MAVKTYDPKMVSVIVGSRIMKGYADGDFVEVESTEDSFTLLVGATGESTRSKNANRSGTAKLTLLASSDDNDYLSALETADQISGRGTFAFMVKDNFGTTLCSAATAWVKKRATVGFGKDAGKREWSFETDEMLMFAGSNT